MMLRSFLLCFVVWLGMNDSPAVFALCGNSVVQENGAEENKESLTDEDSVAVWQSADVPDLMKLVGQTIDVLFNDGQMQGVQTVVSVAQGKTPGSLRSFKVQGKDSKRTKTIGGARVGELWVNDHPLDVVYDKKQRGLVHSPDKRQVRIAYQQEVNQRLAATRDQLWKPLSDVEQKQFVDAQQEFMKQAKTRMPQLAFREIETEFFSVLTDLPPEQVDGYLVLLDEMYRELCKAFGQAAQKNIWCGKCVVILFSRKADYYAFETGVMKNPNPVGTQGLCHMASDGQVTFAGYRGDDPDYFGVVLIHETTHGFVHRYLSSVRIPSWLDEGMSDWIAHAIMKSKHVPLKQIQSAQFIRAAGGWGDFLTTERIRGELYGAASTMVAILLNRDKGGQFRSFFRGIKEGKAIDESLKDTFDMSYRTLEILYAEKIARLKP